MTCYECVFIARQELSSTQSEQLADQMAGIIAENGGEIKTREYWGLKNLAYRIKKNRKGHYTMFHIDAPPDAVLEMERNMGLSEDILRFLIIRMDSLPEGPSIMMQARSERGDRGRRDRPPRQDRPASANRGEAKQKPVATGTASGVEPATPEPAPEPAET